MLSRRGFHHLAGEYGWDYDLYVAERTGLASRIQWKEFEPLDGSPNTFSSALPNTPQRWRDTRSSTSAGAGTNPQTGDTQPTTPTQP